jgi:hypothetical protein
LIVAIIKKVKDKRGGPAGKDSTAVTMPSFSYAADELANVIVMLWANQNNIRDDVMKRDKGVPTQDAVKKATDLINSEANLALRRAVIISEEEHDGDYTMQDDDEVVFVLPNEHRVVRAGASAGDINNTAKILMACTPNGI